MKEREDYAGQDQLIDIKRKQGEIVEFRIYGPP